MGSSALEKSLGSSSSSFLFVDKNPEPSGGRELLRPWESDQNSRGLSDSKVYVSSPHQTAC